MEDEKKDGDQGGSVVAADLSEGPLLDSQAEESENAPNPSPPPAQRTQILLLRALRR